MSGRKQELRSFRKLKKALSDETNRLNAALARFEDVLRVGGFTVAATVPVDSDGSCSWGRYADRHGDVSWRILYAENGGPMRPLPNVSLDARVQIAHVLGDLVDAVACAEE